MVFRNPDRGDHYKGEINREAKPELVARRGQAAEETSRNLDRNEVVEDSKEYSLGDINVEVRSLTTSYGPQFFSMHDNENTVIPVIESLMGRYQRGRFIEFIHSGARNISFKIDGRTYVIDPNRMFTEKGRRTSLRKLSHRRNPITRKVLLAVRMFAKQVMNDHRLNKPLGGVLVALHNNTPGGTCHVKHYLDRNGDPIEGISAVHVEQGTDPDDFFMTTHSGFFNFAKRRGFNAVLQDSGAVLDKVDDGSLSIYCGKEGINYINIEAQHGHATQQEAMIKALFIYLDMLKDRNEGVRRSASEYQRPRRRVRE
jgi:hypothetical protein